MRAGCLGTRVVMKRAHCRTMLQEYLSCIALEMLDRHAQLSSASSLLESNVFCIYVGSSWSFCMDAWGFCISHETCIMSYAQVRWASPCNEVNAQCRSLWGKTTYFCVICLRLVGTACYCIIPKRCFEMLFDLLITLTHTSCVHTYMQLPVFCQA